MNMKTVIIEIVLKHIFIFSNKKNIDFLLFSTQKNSKKEEAKKNIQIIERIIDVVNKTNW
jgi:hypothetical protein